jgi:hypothetical protein
MPTGGAWLPRPWRVEVSFVARVENSVGDPYDAAGSSRAARLRGGAFAPSRHAHSQCAAGAAAQRDRPMLEQSSAVRRPATQATSRPLASHVSMPGENGVQSSLACWQYDVPLAAAHVSPAAPQSIVVCGCEDVHTTARVPVQAPVTSVDSGHSAGSTASVHLPDAQTCPRAQHSTVLSTPKPQTLMLWPSLQVTPAVQLADRTHRSAPADGRHVSPGWYGVPHGMRNFPLWVQEKSAPSPHATSSVHGAPAAWTNAAATLASHVVAFAIAASIPCCIAKPGRSGLTLDASHDVQSEK